jgi:N-acyl-D-aspartate/D-glutamate deacylase
VAKLVEEARRPVLFQAVAASRHDGEIHRRTMRWIEELRGKGLPIFGQAGTLRAGFGFTLEHWNLYDIVPAWREMTTGTKEEKLAKMRNPQLRAEAKAERWTRALDKNAAGIGGRIVRLVVQYVNDQPDLEKYLGKFVGQIAEEEGKHPVDVMLDLAIATDLKAEFLTPVQKFNPDYIAEIINDSIYTFPGVSDGGAHTKFFTGGAFTTDFLCWMVRDEQKIGLEEAHYRMSALPAHAAGFRDRGVLREGAWADVVVYDLNGLGIEPQWVGEVAHDLPGGEWRRVKRAKGYRSIIVNGAETFAEGKCTGATPGKLLRHGRTDN